MNPSNATVVRVVVIACAVTAAFAGAIFAIRGMSHILTLMVVAAFIAVILAPPVDHLVRRRRFRRGFAVMTVFLVGIIVFSAMTFAFVRPIVDQSRTFVDDLPTFVEDAKAGRGRVGEVVQRYNLDEFVEDNQDKLEEARCRARQPRRAPRRHGRQQRRRDRDGARAEHLDVDVRPGHPAGIP